MKQKSQTFTPHWAWLIVVMLGLTFLVGARLDMDGFWYDEVFTVRNANGAGYGDSTLMGIYQSIQADDPYQAIGYPLTIALWGAGVGWSEFALRVSSFLFALIGLALTYRLGRDVTNSAWVGLLASVIFAFSTFTVHYAHELRAFTFVTIFSTLTVWAYWRILEKPSRTAYIIFTLGGIGILYTHYYAAMLLIALGVYHLLFAPKNRAWFIVPLCGLLMALAFIPQFPAFIEGYTRFDPANVEKTPMSALEVLNSLLYYIGNGTNILTLALMLLGIAVIFLQKSRLGIVVGIAILGTAVLIISNEALNILEPTRLRYAIFLWSLFAVWISASLVFVAEFIAQRLNQPKIYPLIVLIFLALWTGNALWRNYTVGFNASIEGTETPRLRTITNILRERGASADLFAFYNGTSAQAWYIQDTLTYSTWDIPMPTLTTASLYDTINPSNQDWAREQIANTNRIWYGANRTFGLNEVHDDFLALMADEFVKCATPVMNDDLSLELFARAETFCQHGRSNIPFGEFILNDYDILQTEDTVSVLLGWELDESIPPETYSLSVQLHNLDTGEVALTQDSGIPYDSFVPMQIDLDTSDLSAGQYELIIVIYDWRTGERLPTPTGDTLVLDTLLLGE